MKMRSIFVLLFIVVNMPIGYSQGNVHIMEIENKSGCTFYFKVDSIKEIRFKEENTPPAKNGLIINNSEIIHFAHLNDGTYLCRKFGLGGISAEYNGLLDIQEMFIGELLGNTISVIRVLGTSDGDTVGPISICRGDVDKWGGQWSGGVHLTNQGFKSAISESIKVFVDGCEIKKNGIFFGDTVCINAINKLYFPQTVNSSDLSTATEAILENRLYTLTDRMNVKVSLKVLNDLFVSAYWGVQIYRYGMDTLYAPNNNLSISLPLKSRFVLKTKEQKVLYSKSTNPSHCYEIEVKPYGLGNFESNDGGDLNCGYFYAETFGKDYFVLIKTLKAYRLFAGDSVKWEAEYNYHIDN